MKRILFLLLAALLIICLGGCGKLVEVPDETIPMPPWTGEPMIFDKDIIGKWELVAEEREGNQIILLEPSEWYIEYLANGKLQFSSDGYDEIEEGYQIYLYWKAYQMDSIYLYWYIDDIVAPYLIYEYTFINRNELKLKEAWSFDKRMLYSYSYIYQRIKEYTDLEGTQWKLAGYADVRTGEFISEESSENCEDCNTMKFVENGIGWGQTIFNSIHLDLSKKGVIGIMTEVDDSDNGHLKLFYEAILTIDSFEYTEDEFKFYYNNKQNYLLYKRNN